jgi:O-antigen/teichoic acid export membrane protein
MVLFLPVLIMRVTAPVINNLLAGGDAAACRNTFRRTIVLNTSVALVLAAFLSLAGKSLMRLFGKDFSAGTPLIILLLGSVVFEVIANNLFQVLFVSGQLWRNLAIVGVWTAVLIASTLVSVPRMGASGLAMSYLLAWGCSASLYALATRSAPWNRRSA